MKSYYGDNVPVEIEYKLEQAENFTVREKD
jgi:hypothetical protein